MQALSREIHASALGGILDCSLRAVAHEERPEEESVQDIASVVGRMAHAVYAEVARSDHDEWSRRNAAAKCWPHRARVRFDATTPSTQAAHEQAIRIGEFAGRLSMLAVPGVTDWLPEIALNGYISGLPVVGTADRLAYPKGSGRKVVDLKTGKGSRPLSYAVQLGAYLEILDLDTDPLIVAVPRVRWGVPGDEVTCDQVREMIPQYVTALNGRNCRALARRAAASWRAVAEGQMKPCPNPASFLCTARTCRIHGTADCPLFAS